ncbi:MAG TPA: 7-carboxy-7-deazaguanine synthase QueE [Gammaproteobacteria bacterium]|nr:7-carboxy-7-deazaguanine synthase QueE [Gammaproteobacteria bacterium]
MPAADRELRICEIFYSLQGESGTAGFPTVFIRLTGCPLRCRYCDTSYAFSGGEHMSLSGILQQVKSYSTRYVTVTGGEPLAQRDCWLLLKMLCDAGYTTSLETSGAIDISQVDKRVSTIMDIKTPGSGESDRNRFQNIELLKSSDQVKFVITDRVDYDWSRQFIEENELTGKCEILFSPVHGELDPVDMAEWILNDNLLVRMQIQLHKYLWGDERGR